MYWMNRNIEICHDGDNLYEIMRVESCGLQCYVIRKNGKPDGFSVYWNIFEARQAIRKRREQNG